MSETIHMRGTEFIKKIRNLAKARDLVCRIDRKRGKGSHITLYYGKQFTVVRNPRDELKASTMHAMLKQLGVDEKDL